MLFPRYFPKYTGPFCKQLSRKLSASSETHTSNPQTEPVRDSLLPLIISRRRFLRALTATPFLLLAGKQAVARQAPRTISLCRCYIAGFQYHSGPAILRALRKGQLLSLKREPNNPHDALAIAVYTTTGKKIGYLPRRLNEIPATLMDQGQPVQSFIHRVTRNAPTWEMVKIQVCLGAR